MRMTNQLSGAAAVLLMCAVCAAAEPLVTETASPGAFALVKDKAAAAVAYDAGDYKVVQITADLFCGDVEKVTGIKPELHPANMPPQEPAKQTVYIGTLGHSPEIDAIVKAKNVDVAAIQGKWESYLITTIDTPTPGVDKGLLVIGSDRRGTAYGVLALSEAAGVSPWVWWADVPAEKHTNLYVAAGTHVHGPPSVKYRGIFLNDEDWGLQPWAAKTFEPTSAGGVGDIGPRTYAKIFELLLRLNANFCWPAMHDVTKAFNIYPQNRQVADDYGIVMGSSHCEPMLRNNVTEWTDAQGRVGQAAAATFNWVTNSADILNYWKQRLQENGKFENVYTLGLRGIHDGDMAGGGTTAQKSQRLNQIIAEQRNLLKQFVNPDPAKVPQIFCPYKEVLTYYQNGAVPPEDVTLVWADDNHGYIRQLSTPAEQKRGGGAGVYYHISYWGRPHDYLWLCTIPPALVWEELSKAYDYNARTLWVINVGDLKPAEIVLTMALAQAYDATRYSLENVNQYLRDFAARTFGPANAGEIAAILGQYYHLNYQRKPEHLGFNTSQNPGGPIQPTEFSDGEIADRLAAFAALVQRADAVYAKLPRAQLDAFYELVLYPVRGSALQNQKMLNLDLHRRAMARGDGSAAKAAADKSQAAYDQIQVETAFFNDGLAGGKWKGIMSAIPHAQDVFKAPVFATVNPDAPLLPPVQAEVGVSAQTGYADAGYFSIAAESYSRKVDRGGAGWKLLPGLGRLGDSMAVYPTTTPSIANIQALAVAAPALEYDFTVTTANPAAKLTVQAIPTHRINPERGLRYAAAIDAETPQIVDLETPENSPIWSTNVLRGAAYGTTTHNIAAGKHTLHIYMVDPGVVLDHLTIDLGKLPKSYLPPAQTPLNS
jgi:hypothetical protein